MGDTKNGRERKGLGKQSQREAAVIERELRLHGSPPDAERPVEDEESDD